MEAPPPDKLADPSGHREGTTERNTRGSRGRAPGRRVSGFPYDASSGFNAEGESPKERMGMTPTPLMEKKGSFADVKTGLVVASAFIELISHVGDQQIRNKLITVTLANIQRIDEILKKELETK